jgi:hypothetical protein
MRAVRIVDLLVKVALVGLLLSALIFPDLSGVKEKAGTARLVVYPLGLLVVPLWWWLYGRRRAGRAESRGAERAESRRAERAASSGAPRNGRGFPWTADLLVSLPWLLDLLGNRFNLFDTVDWWDDWMHFLNWLLLTAGVLLAWSARGVSRGVVVMCAVGFGLTAALLWELGEYFAFIRTSPELTTAYTDTLGDLTLGGLGSLLAGVAVAYLRRRVPGNI